MIVVTGSAGFIGSQIALHLALTGEPLFLVDKLNLFTERKYTEIPGKKFQYEEADQVFLSRIRQLKDVSWVIHMGAITNMAEKDSQALQKWNVDYTKAIWNYCCERRVNLIYASSAATYGSGSQGFSDFFDVIPRFKPLNPYGQSKHEFDLYALSRKETPPLWYGLKFFNVYGSNEGYKGRMASAAWHGYNEIKKTGEMMLFRFYTDTVKDGDQVCDFIFIKDVLSVMDFLRNNIPVCGIYNCGIGQVSTFMELVEALFKTLRWLLKINWIDTSQEFRVAYQYHTQAEMHKLRAAGYSKLFTKLSDGIAAYLGG